MKDLAKKYRGSILRPSHRKSQRIPEETEAASLTAQTDQSKDEDDFPPVPAGFDDCSVVKGAPWQRELQECVKPAANESTQLL